MTDIDYKINHLRDFTTMFHVRKLTLAIFSNHDIDVNDALNLLDRTQYLAKFESVFVLCFIRLLGRSILLRCTHAASGCVYYYLTIDMQITPDPHSAYYSHNIGSF